jgi:hypothetical protein
MAGTGYQDEIRKLLNEMIEAQNSGDAPRLRTMLSERPDAVHIGDRRRGMVDQRPGRGCCGRRRQREWHPDGRRRQADLHAVLADDEHGVALVVATASRGDRSMTSNEAHVMHMRDGKVVGVWVAPTDQYALDEFFGWPGGKRSQGIRQGTMIVSIGVQLKL